MFLKTYKQLTYLVTGVFCCHAAQYRCAQCTTFPSVLVMTVIAQKAAVQPLFSTGNLVEIMFYGWLLKSIFLRTLVRNIVDMSFLRISCFRLV